MQARSARHTRVFAEVGIFRWPVFNWLGFLNRANAGDTAQKKRGLSFHFPKGQFHTLHSPVHKLFGRYSAFVAILLIAGSISPVSTSFTSVYTDSSYSEVENFWDVTPDTAILTDQDGYLTKLNPQTGTGDRSGVHDLLTHTVTAAETVSTIAAKYGLKSSTVLWINNITNANSIRVNQQLLIPPLDGVYHHVGKGESVEKIAKLYGVGGENISKQNSLTAGTILSAGDELFIPGGKPLVAKNPASARFNYRVSRDTPARIASATRVNSAIGGAILNDSQDAPVEGKPFIFPTHGKVTQSFHRGHYAVDIGNFDRPVVWAAGEGEVVGVVDGCTDISYRCGNGYGNHVIIDHGDGLQTLYAHLTYTSVQVGDKVKQGQVIGKMGRSGNVHGPTGIHLHFETHKNGVKVLPSKYY